MCADTHLILSRLILSAWYSLSVPPSYHILNPEALARSPTVAAELPVGLEPLQTQGIQSKTTGDWDLCLEHPARPL